MRIIRSTALLLSALIIRLIKAGDIDYSVCDPINQTAVPPPPPALPISFSTNIEWKWVDKNETISVKEIQDGINKIGSQTITKLGQTTQIIYDYKEHQYIVFNEQNKDCKATPLGSLAFFESNYWLTATNMTYTLAVREGHAPYIGYAVVRNLTVRHWRSCLYDIEFDITVEINMYFSVDGWGMALSDPSSLVPVRFEMKGSRNYNETGANATYFHVIGDFIDFIPTPPTDLTTLQLPSGTFCKGRKSSKPMNLLPESFSLVMENIHQDYFKIEYESTWFHSTKKLIRRDFKDSFGSDPDPTIEIFDFNLGIHYSIDSYTGTCYSPTVIGTGDLYVRNHGDNTVEMESSLDFFHVRNANIQYVGTRTIRGVACDVWVGKYLDVLTAKYDIVEWYFTKDNWVEAVDLVIQPASLVRMDVWKGGAIKPVIHNIYHLNPVKPTLDMFSVTLCYNSTQRRRILIPFKATDGGRIDRVSIRYLKSLLHDALTTQAFIDPLRMTDIMLEYQGTSMVYLAATILDRPPLTNSRLFPQPSPSSKLHDLKETYFFLNGVVNGPLTITVNSTLGKMVTLQSTGLFNIDYPLDVSSTTSTTTVSTTEATPPPPTRAPTTVKQIIPSPDTIRHTASTSTTTSTSTAMSTSSPTTTASTKIVSTQQSCTCPKVTCPTVTFPSTRKPTKCPTQANPSPCPTINKVSVMSKSSSATTSKGSSTPYTTMKSSLITANRVSSRKTTKHATYSFSPTNRYLGNHQDPSGKSGLSGGVAAAIAIVMLLVGLVCGVIAVRVFQKYRRSQPSEGKNILSKYLDDDLKY